MLESVLNRRLVFVTGKGGVGRSTVATALGILAARRGQRTMVAEIAGQSRIAGLFGRESRPFAELELAPDLHTISVDPERAMDEYLRVKVGPLGRLLGGSRVFGALTMATPGMLELLTLGKLWELAQLERRTPGASPYDLVIVDAPATGHGVGFLRTPATFVEIARVGPIARQGGRIAETIADRAFTAVVAVSLPEEMAVAETIALERALADQGLELELVALNARYPDRFGEADIGPLCAALEAASTPTSRSALAAAVSELSRARAQALLEDRLRAQLTAPVLTLPYLFTARLGPAELGRLADVLATSL